LILVGNTLYGTAESGGTNGNGTVFALGLDGPNPAIPPVVTWNTPAPITYGSAIGSSQLDATANVPGNFAYDPLPGTVFSNIGTYPLSVIFTPADTMHYSCLTDTVSLVVTLPQLTVTANNATRRADSLNPVFTGTITGLVNGDNITAAYSCSAVSNSPPGTYPIVPSLGDPDHRATNYNVNLVNGTLTVTPIVAVFSVVHGFSAVSNGRPAANSDGAGPMAGLIVSGHTLYGTASSGGSGGTGTLFAVNTDGADFTTLYNFLPVASGCCGFEQNSDGMSPDGTLILSGNTLYGPTENGGNGYVGTLFEINTNGADFENLHVFQNVYINAQNYPVNGDGAFPYAGLILTNGTLYGTAIYGGSQGDGVVFKVNTNGTGFTTLHNFASASDGVGVFAGLVLSGNTLYGTAQGGGTNGGGTVFAVNTDGSGFATLHSFSPASDGTGPDGALLLLGNILYGTAGAGGSSSNGTVFAINTNGTGFTNLYSFTALNNTTNSDGAEPLAGLILSTDSTTLYGTATRGGSAGYGTVFAINTNGTGFTNLYSFTGGLDGAGPDAGLVSSGYTLYGTTSRGGSSGWGTIFSLTCLMPQLNISISRANVDEKEVVLTWPAGLEGFSYAGLTLQSTTNLSAPAWSDVSTLPVVINGQYTVATSIRASQMFYRLYENLSQ
jgi:uncharacterized repeat protein (TIGR03803 family)